MRTSLRHSVFASLTLCWFPTLRGWCVWASRGALVRWCGGGSRFSSGGLTTTYPLVRAGLRVRFALVWVIGQRGPVEVNPMRCVDVSGGVGRSRRFRGSALHRSARAHAFKGSFTGRCGRFAWRLPQLRSRSGSGGWTTRLTAGCSPVIPYDRCRASFAIGGCAPLVTT